MPEVCEVALTSEILLKYLKNKILISFEFESGRYLKNKPEDYHSFVKQLPLKIMNIDTVGKFMWFDLMDKDANHWYIWNTFGLTGMWSIFKPKTYRAKLKFEEDIDVYFSDLRNFGTFKFSTSKIDLRDKINKLSPDFLKDNFDIMLVKKYDQPIVKILMDQTKIGSGLGNYLTAEILYRAHISPHRLGISLTNKELHNLEYWIKYVTKQCYINNHIGYMINLEESVKHIKKENYHPDINITSEEFKFMVYRKKIDPLGQYVKADKSLIKGRTTYWVPTIQK
uniref:Formamidopyrimidine-DNA glycosylase catalytic domain-containing protein n=1 Tax=viral metagenome TaxID=1070528 RepID=A0A6C0LR81_9ZZZZ